MPEDTLKKTVLSSLFWKYGEQLGVAAAQAVITVVLARLLLPEDYGIIALITIFIAIAQVFVVSGFNTALIQKKNADDTDFSSVFYLSLFTALICYGILFVASPFIADFYENEQITPVLRVLGINLFFGAVNSIQRTFISRNFKFKKLFFSSMGAVVVSGTVGIIIATLGCGVWALVGQQIGSQIAICCIMWITVKWRPKLLFSFARVKGLFSFGWKLLVSALLDTGYREVKTLIIGRLFSPKMLGFYSQGSVYPNMIVGTLNSAIQTVMPPAYAKNQDSKETVKAIMRRALKTSAFLVFPAMAGLAAIAEPMVLVLLTDKWLMAVPFIQIFACIYALYPIHTVNLQALNGIGRSDMFLRLEIIKKILGIIVLCITIPMGIYAIALGGIVSGIISTFINSYPNKKLLNYSFFAQWRDLLPSLLLSGVMFGVVYLVTLTPLPAWLMLIIQIPLGIAVYFGLAKLFKVEALQYGLDTIKELLGKKKVQKEE